MLSILIAVTLIGGLYRQGPTAILTSEVPSYLSMKDRQANQQQKEAERVWEQAIAAKGGRDRLYAVCNMVISTRKDTTGMSSIAQVRREELLVFPNQYWFWDDYRPDVFGVNVHMYNYDNNTCRYSATIRRTIHHGQQQIPKAEKLLETTNFLSCWNLSG